MLRKRSNQSFKHDEDYKERSEISHHDLPDLTKHSRDEEDKENFNEEERKINQSKLYELLSLYKNLYQLKDSFDKSFKLKIIILNYLSFIIIFSFILNHLLLIFILWLKKAYHFCWNLLD